MVAFNRLYAKEPCVTYIPNDAIKTSSWADCLGLFLLWIVLGLLFFGGWYAAWYVAALAVRRAWDF